MKSCCIEFKNTPQWIRPDTKDMSWYILGICHKCRVDIQKMIMRRKIKIVGDTNDERRIS